MMNWKKEKPLRGGKGLIKLSYFISKIVTNTDQLICRPLCGRSKRRIRIRSKEVSK
jgi:hypothetical protein